MIKSLGYVVIFLVISFGGFSQRSVAENIDPLTIFAASSLTNVLQKQANNWAQDTNNQLPRLSFAGSAVMARQIKAGAPADIFISANPNWIDFLEAASLTDSAKNIAANSLVLAAPKTILKQATEKDIISIINSNHIAIADPETAPAGAYAKRYLEQLGNWHQVKGRLAYGSNVRQTLLLIEKGGFYGFVYKTDALRSDFVNIIHTVPQTQTGQIMYVAAKIKGAQQQADSFIAYLQSATGRAIWAEAGFVPPVSN